MALLDTLQAALAEGLRSTVSHAVVTHTSPCGIPGCSGRALGQRCARCRRTTCATHTYAGVAGLTCASCVIDLNADLLDSNTPEHT